MKKNIYLLILSIFLSTTNVYAEPVSKHNNYNKKHYSTSNKIIVKTKYFNDEHNFQNCTEHTLLSNTLVTFYSDGTKNTETKYTILNKDGSILIKDCYEIDHIIHNKKHYFLFKKNKNYQIMDEDGNIITTKNYNSLKEIASNRILCKFDKKYGVIDLEENIIIPIKYKSFEKIGKNIYITKLNGYYGLLDCNNNILIKNEYDSIKQKNNVFILKKEDKYGLANNEANIICDAKYDKIKDLGEYIIIKNGNKYGVLNPYKNILTEIKYKKIRLNRNELEGKNNNNIWEKIIIND